MQKLDTEYNRLSAYPSASDLIRMLMRYPYVSIPMVRKELSLSYPGAKSLIDRFVESGILHEIATDRKPRFFCARGILDVLASD